MIFDVAIIGGGPVGIYAAFSVGIEGLSSVIIEANDKLGGQCTSFYSEKYIYDLPGHHKIKAKELIENLIKQVSIFNPEILLNEFVLSIKKENEIFNIITKSNKTIQSKSIIIALGAGIFQPIKLQQEIAIKLEGKKIFYDFDNIEKYKNKTVAILGGSNTALDYSIDLFSIAQKIYLIHRREKFTGFKNSIEKIKKISNIEIKTPFLIENIFHEDQLILSLKNDEIIETLKVDYILACYGLKTSFSFIEKWNLQLVNNKIFVNAFTMQTSLNDIYAVGDCVSYQNRRNLLLSGFNETMIAAKSIAQNINPDKKIETYSSNNAIFNCQNS